ncbi:integrase, catalytic region, zinc finger, CCHC-type containing protein [Tanacetum coccineum]
MYVTSIFHSRLVRKRLRKLKYKNNVDNVFQADDCDAFDSNVDEAPMAQTIFMANLSSADPVYDEADPSYDSDILSKVHDHDHYQDVICEHHEEHEMHDDVQPNCVVDSHANYTSDSNMIPYDQYVKDNAVPVVQSNVSSVPNDAYMMIFNDMHELHAQSVSDITRNIVVDNSLTAKLATYKEQVELIVITDRNIKEENLKKELHSVKMQLACTINHYKSIVEEVTSLKKDFKQKENKYLEEFLDMKALKEKVEDKLYKQDQSLQTVHMLCKPKPYYNEQNKVAISYKNPLCLTRAKQVQPALYNGYEIIRNTHVPDLVHNTEDTLEIAEITRRKMNDKMKDSKYVTHKVNIAPPDYSKENYLATFTPQKQLTPEQIFWSQDLIKMKEEALKKQTTASRPIKALTVYPPNTPATLVPRVLPTKRERGFEQTKECYLTEVIPFFKTLKEHFEGIQKALTKEIKEMKDIFEELEAEVDQNVVNRKHDEIERKNLLIANDNLIADCLSKEVFYIATNSELTVSRFTEMHETHTIVQTRCLELEAELSKLRDKLKYQNLKESFGNNPYSPARDTPDFDSVFIIGKMKASIQGKDNAIKKLRTQISQLKETRSEADRTLDFRTLDFQITQLTEKVVQIVLWYLDSGCSKHMTGDRSRLRNFMKKFIGTVRFGNDHFGAIMGYGDYVIGDSVISRVYYVEGLGHNLFSVGQFCDSDLEVAFRKHSCYVRDTDGVELIKGSRGSNLYTISVEDMMKSSPICLLSKASKNKSWLWHRRLNHLNFGTINDLARKDLVRGLPRLKFEKDQAAKTMLIFSKALMFLWEEAVATACYTQNQSLIHTLHNKTSYELVHDKKPDLTFFCVFGALCYPINDSEDIGKLQPTTDIGIFIGYAPSRKGY